MSIGKHDHRLLAWRGPRPRRVDTAQVEFASDSLTAHGSSVSADYTMDYRLVTGTSWVTETLDIRSRGEGWWRSLMLQRSATGQWTAQWAGDGARSSACATPTLPMLGDALDCDIALCPLTNTMPILRHELVGAAHAGRQVSADLTMAFVSVPDLTVTSSRQHYSSAAPVDGGALVAYSSERFATTLEVDGDGLVINYPGLGRRLDLFG